MCGLVGIAGDTTSGNYKEVFTQLLLVDSIRGMHSTGVAIVPRFSKLDPPTLVKEIGPATNLICSEEYSKALKVASKVLIGHNRHATKGKHTIENAHPFEFDHLIGAHNGTLDWSSIQDLYQHELYGTDSEAIFADLNKFGLRKTVDKLEGAWALTWFDKRDSSLNFLRNAKRPLHYAYSQDRCTLMWASECLMLRFIIERSGLKIEQGKDGPKIYLTGEDKHLRWVIPQSINDKILGPFEEEMKPAPKPAKKEYNWLYSGAKKHQHGATTVYYGAAKEAQDQATLDAMIGAVDDIPFVADPEPKKVYPKPVLVAPKKQPRINTKKWRPPYKDIHGKIINKVAFEEYIESGCVFCDSHEMKWGEFILPLQDDVDGRKIFLCKECYDDESTFACVEYMM